jgi:hypothetical protein
VLDKSKEHLMLIFFAFIFGIKKSICVYTSTRTLAGGIAKSSRIIAPPSSYYSLYIYET